MVRKKAFITLFIATLCIPAAVFAANMKVNKDNLVINADETIKNDVYGASGNISVNGKIEGDLVAAGGQIVVSGEVGQDVMILGGQVTISGKVGDDVRLIGGTLTVSGEIHGDLVVAGGTVDIQDKAKVSGDVKIGSGQARISGETGSVDVAVGSIVIASTAKINGDFVYFSEADANVETGSKITGGVVHNRPEGTNKKDFFSMYIGSKIVSILMALIAVLFIYLLFPNKSQKIAESVKTNFWKNILPGLGFLVLAPVVILLLLVTVLGAPLALSGAAVYGIILYIGKIFGIIALAMFIKGAMEKGETDSKLSWIVLALSVLLYTFVKMIPLVGWVLVTLLYLSAVGAAVKFYLGLIKKLKTDKVI